MLWILIVQITLVVMAVLLWPLWRGAGPAAGRREHDLAVYRAQLAEIDGDVARGVVSAADAANARLEVERRLLRVADEGDGKPMLARPARVAAVVLAVLAPALALGLYLRLGTPAAPDQPLAQRGLAPQQQQAAAPSMEMANLISRLVERLKNEPNDRAGWILLGRSYLMTEQSAKAAEAYGRAVALDGNDAEVQMAFGEAQVYVADGIVTPRALTAFETALKLDPKHPGARYYLALARAQAGDNKAALEQWSALAADSAPDAPWMNALRSRMEEAARTAGVPMPQIASATEAPRGPTVEQMQAAQQMPDGDRNAMIQSMVQGLAERLKTSPDDYDGWMRLARAYTVLRNIDAARAAYDKAIDLRPVEVAPRQAKAALTESAAPPASPHAAAPAAPPAGPNAEQMAAAQRMSPEDRGAMIRGMVDSLAERLRANPEDYEGWLRLGRAQTVLKNYPAARDAYGKAAALRPNDVDTLASWGNAIVEADGGDAVRLSPAAIEVFRKTLVLAPNQPDALWFIGRAEAEAGNKEPARQFWTRLLAQLDPKGEGYADVKWNLDALR